MEFLELKVQQGEHKFDWDDISVGNTQLDHSQQFFYEELLQQKMINIEISDSIRSTTFNGEKENIMRSQCTSWGDKQDDNEAAYTSPKICGMKNKEKCGSSRVGCKKQLLSFKEVQIIQEPSRNVHNNLACEWSTTKPTTLDMASKGALMKSVPPPPQAYLVKDIYQRNRIEAERRRAKEERKLREFHSRPAPKFNRHDQLEICKSIHTVTEAITPKVLKRSRETDEKRRKKLEEWKQSNQPRKFESRPPTVLKEKPFVPEKKKFVFEQCPFNLHVEKRLQERKHYDMIRQKETAEKLKQVEEERKRIEKEQIKELRNAATFKARPNPFKN